MGRKLLSMEEVCARLRVKPRWITQTRYRMNSGITKSKLLPPMLKVGGKYLCYEDELNVWLESQKVVSP